MHVSRTLDAAY